MAWENEVGCEGCAKAAYCSDQFLYAFRNLSASWIQERAGSSSGVKTIKRGLLKLGPYPDWPTGPAKTAWNPRYLELTVVGCLSEKALADAGRDDVGPDQPAAWAALAHQLRFHDDYEPLSRPLHLHLARLAEEYVRPTESTAPAE